MESETSNVLQTQLKLARRSIVHYSNRLKKKRKRKSTGCGPSPAALLLKAALDQPTLDHVIIPVPNHSDDESSSAEELEKNKTVPELRSALKEIQKCQKLIDEQINRISGTKDGNPMERLALLQISIGALGDSARKFVELAERQIEQNENGQKSTGSSSIVSQLSDENLEEFYDALDTNLTLSMPVIYRGEEEKMGAEQKMFRRTVPNRPSNSINYLAFLRNCLSQSKDLSRIAMPVDFNEPLSALQRLTEDLDYTHLLDEAANESNPQRRLALVSIFALTAYSTSAQRTSKPFNPLLGETYECDRIHDKGFISVAEQTSHHPATSALWARGKEWTLQQAYTPTTKIKGRSLYLNPVGSTYIRFKNFSDLFAYGKVTTITTMTNLVSGKLHTENNGELTVTNIETGDKCVLKFHEQGYFSRDTARKVSGTVTDCNERTHFEIEAVWDRHAILKCLNTQTSNLIWKTNPLPKDSEKMHNFTRFAIELNEPDPKVPPTDSRNRIDQRVMEEGHWDKANVFKQQLEANQRARRTEREEKGIEYKPLWFRTKEPSDQVDNNDVYVFDESYLSCRQSSDWSQCPRIFDI